MATGGEEGRGLLHLPRSSVEVVIVSQVGVTVASLRIHHMSTLLSARDLAKSFPSALLFEGVAIHVAEQDRLGIIGPNGAGKTTLLKILADVDQPDYGEIVRRRNLKLVYVEQDDRFPDGATPSSAVVDTLVRLLGVLVAKTSAVSARGTGGDLGRRSPRMLRFHWAKL